MLIYLARLNDQHLDRPVPAFMMHHANDRVVRLYETMAAAAVPVIIADDWVAPDGVEWQHFSIRWPEGRTDGLVELLESRRSEAELMGRQARAVDEALFSPDTYFHGVADLCAELIESGATERFPAAGVRDSLWARRSAEQLVGRARYVRAAMAIRTRRALRGTRE